MTSSQITAAWTDVYNAPEVSLKTLGYLRAQFKNRLHQLVIAEFEKKEEGGFTKAELARRIHKKPEQITRLLGAPGNWTLDTVSDLLLGMGGRLSYSFEPFNQNSPLNFLPRATAEEPIDPSQGGAPAIKEKSTVMQLLAEGKSQTGASLGSLHNPQRPSWMPQT